MYQVAPVPEAPVQPSRAPTSFNDSRGLRQYPPGGRPQHNQQYSGGPRSPMRRDARDFPASPRRDMTCHECGKPGHFAADCWSKLQCSECGGTGHPAENCFRKCEVCGKVHPRGQCEARGVMEEMKKMMEEMKTLMTKTSAQPRAATSPRPSTSGN